MDHEIVEVQGGSGLRMTRQTVIAHISDVHLAPLIGFWPRHWTVKRALGFANWHRRRKRDHLRSALDRLVDDIHAQAPDHIAVTGDLVNIGLPGEYVQAARWLEELGPPDRVSLVPGNHDIYVKLRHDPGVERWRSYMLPDVGGRELTSNSQTGFPYARLVGDVALICLNSAVPTRPGFASGRLGAAQLRVAEDLLRAASDQKLFRCILIHHPPLPGQATRLRGLDDADDFRKLIETVGADLVLHGHNHYNMLAWCAHRGAQIPVVGVPSASMGRTRGREALARYNLFSISREGAGWTVELAGRGLAQPDGPVIELERRTLMHAQTPAYP